MAWKNI